MGGLLAFLDGLGLLTAYAIVFDGTDELVSKLKLNMQPLGAFFVKQAMQKGIFHKGLDEKGRHLDVFDPLRLDGVMELLFEAQLFQGEVELQQFEFLVEVNEVLVGVAEGAADEVGKDVEVGVGVLDVTLEDKVLDGVEGIEDEVGVHLGLDGHEFGGIEFIEQLGLLALALEQVSENEGDQDKEGKRNSQDKPPTSIIGAGNFKVVGEDAALSALVFGLGEQGVCARSEGVVHDGCRRVRMGMPVLVVALQPVADLGGFLVTKGGGTQMEVEFALLALEDGRVGWMRPLVIDEEVGEPEAGGLGTLLLVAEVDGLYSPGMADPEEGVLEDKVEDSCGKAMDLADVFEQGAVVGELVEGMGGFGQQSLACDCQFAEMLGKWLVEPKLFQEETLMQKQDPIFLGSKDKGIAPSHHCGREDVRMVPLQPAALPLGRDHKKAL